MSFNVQEALNLCTATLAKRKSVQKTSYVLYFSNSEHRYDGKITGSTIKALIKEFRDSHATYKYAYITKMNDDKVLRFYNRAEGKKFFSMTRIGKSKK